MKHCILSLSALFAILLMSSCEKVIHIHLNATNPQYVIEGNINDKPGPYRISVTQTVNFEKDNIFPGVDTALVIVSDDSGITDTLTNTGNGNYITSKISGVVGRTYYLTVKIGSRVFTSTSKIPQPIAMDSLYSQNANAFGDKLIFMVPVIKDPENIANFYNFKLLINKVQSKGIYCTDDVFFSGQKISLSLFPDGGPNSDNDKIRVGDSVQVILEAIEEPVYNYFFSLGETIGQNSASPSNPNSNISGGCLGYFSTSANTSRTVLITE